MWPLTGSLLKRIFFVLFYSKLFVYLIVCVKITNAVLPEYCLRPLNISDCNLKPTLVFSYYKPGSRCEIKSWKGCPTLNKFKDEYECSNMCIGRLSDNSLQQSIIRDENKDGIDDNVNLCIENLNTSKCSNVETTVFTYNLENETCTSTKYYGCGGNNIFDSMETCKEMCNEKNELKNLPVSEIEKLTALISNLNFNVDTEISEPERSNLKKVKNNEEISENSDETDSIIVTPSNSEKNIESQKLTQITAGDTNSFASNSGDELTPTIYTTSNTGKDLALTTHITSTSSDTSTSTDYSKVYSKVTKQDSTTTSTQLTTTMSTLTSTRRPFKYADEIIMEESITLPPKRKR